MWFDYWPMPFFFGPLFMILIFVLCLGMMMFMMRGHRHSAGSGALENSQRALRARRNQPGRA